MISATSGLMAAVVLLLAAPVGSASPPSIFHPPPGSFTATSTSTCHSAITINGASSNDTVAAFFDNSGNLTAIIDRFVEVDTFIGPTGDTLVGVPYHAVTQVRFDSSGNATSVYELAVLEKVPLPDGTTAVFAGRLDLIAASVTNPGSFVFIPDTGASTNLAGFCAALGAGQPKPPSYS